MSNPKQNIKVLFFVPHPDDLEFGAPLACIKMLKLGYDVVEVLMTNGDYGTKRTEFKGNRIAQIRKQELEKTVEIYKKYTNNQLSIIRMGYIDGFLPLNNKAINKVVNLIRKERPDIIFAPDPVYPKDLHYDHINTGRIVYFALKRLTKEELPKKALFYYSFNNNYFLRVKCSDLKITLEAITQHKSQVVLFIVKLYLFLYKRLQIFGNFLRYQMISMRYRELKFKDGKPENSKPFKSLRNRIKWVFYYNTMNVYKEETYKPSPKELGLSFPD